MLNMAISYFEKSIDPDQLASDQDPHCFLLCLLINVLDCNPSAQANIGLKNTGVR